MNDDKTGAARRARRRRACALIARSPAGRTLALMCTPLDRVGPFPTFMIRRGLAPVAILCPSSCCPIARSPVLLPAGIIPKG